DLGHHGVGTRAEVGGARLHDGASVRLQPHARRAGLALGGPRRARHAHADEPAPFPRRARLRIAPRPPEALGPDAIALEQRVAGERQPAATLVVARRIADAQLD